MDAKSSIRIGGGGGRDLYVRNILHVDVICNKYAKKSLHKLNTNLLQRFMTLTIYMNAILSLESNACFISFYALLQLHHHTTLQWLQNLLALKVTVEPYHGKYNEQG